MLLFNLCTSNHFYVATFAVFCCDFLWKTRFCSFLTSIISRLENVLVLLGLLTTTLAGKLTEPVANPALSRSQVFLVVCSAAAAVLVRMIITTLCWPLNCSSAAAEDLNSRHRRSATRQDRHIVPVIGRDWHWDTVGGWLSEWVMAGGWGLGRCRGGQDDVVAATQHPWPADYPASNVSTAQIKHILMLQEWKEEKNPLRELRRASTSSRSHLITQDAPLSYWIAV